MIQAVFTKLFDKRQLIFLTASLIRLERKKLDIIPRGTIKVL